MSNFDAVDVNEYSIQTGPSLQIDFLPMKFLSFVVFNIFIVALYTLVIRLIICCLFLFVLTYSALISLNTDIKCIIHEHTY